MYPAIAKTRLHTISDKITTAKTILHILQTGLQIKKERA
jgi:hypothetical protein